MLNLMINLFASVLGDTCHEMCPVKLLTVHGVQHDSQIGVAHGMLVVCLICTSINDTFFIIFLFFSIF